MLSRGNERRWKWQQNALFPEQVIRRSRSLFIFNSAFFSCSSDIPSQTLPLSLWALQAGLLFVSRCSSNVSFVSAIRRGNDKQMRERERENRARGGGGGGGWGVFAAAAAALSRVVAMEMCIDVRLYRGDKKNSSFLFRSLFRSTNNEPSRRRRCPSYPSFRSGVQFREIFSFIFPWIFLMLNELCFYYFPVGCGIVFIFSTAVVCSNWKFFHVTLSRRVKKVPEKVIFQNFKIEQQNVAIQWAVLMYLLMHTKNL